MSSRIGSKASRTLRSALLRLWLPLLFASPVLGGTITVTYPTTGATLWKGHIYYIQWTSSGVTGNVRVQVLRSDTVYYSLAADDPNDGILEFGVPFGNAQTPGYSWPTDGNYKIRVLARNGSGTGVTGNISVASPTLHVDYPNSSETLIRGQSVRLRWSNNQVESGVPIHLQWWKNGVADRLIDGNASNTGYYDYTIPTDLSPETNYKLGISAYYEGEVWDFSDTYSTITGQVTITFPYGGTTLWKGHEYHIAWNSLGVSGNVRVQVYHGGSLYYQLAADDPNDGDLIFGVPFSHHQTEGSDWPEDGTYQIHIEARDGSGSATTGYFSIVRPTLHVTYPNGGETLAPGSVVTLSWTNNQVESFVPIHLQWQRSGVAGRMIDAGASNTGSYTYAVPTDLAAGNDYKLGISAYYDGEVWDYSDSYLSVGSTTAITFPTAGTTLWKGHVYHFTWTPGGMSGNVRVQIYRNGSLHYQLAADDPNDGDLVFDAPFSHNQTAGCDWPEDGNYQLHVEARNGSGSATSGNFTLSAPTIHILWPNGGQTLHGGDVVTLTWSTYQVEGQNIHLQWWRSGSDDRMIAASAPNTGAYSYSVPCDIATGVDYRLSASAYYNGEIWDYSDAYCSLTGIPTPSLTAPANGGSLVGPAYVFVWTAVPGATGYHLRVATDAAFTNIVAETSSLAGSATSHATSNFMQWGIVHYWQLCVSDGSCWGPWTSPSSFTPCGTALAAPALVSPAAGATVLRSTTFAWNGVAGSSGYRLQICTDAAGSNVVGEFNFGSGITSTTISIPTAIGAGQTGYWHMRSIDAANGREGAWSASRSFTITSSLPIPAAATILSPANTMVSQPAVTFAWQAATNATSYRVQYASTAAFTTGVVNLPEVSATSNTATLGLVYSPLSLFWRVAGVNSAGSGPWSSTATFTYAALQSAPIASVTITNPTAELTLRPNTTYYTSGHATGAYSGSVNCTWIVNGATHSSGSASMTPSGGAEAPTGSFVTSAAGSQITLQLHVCVPSGTCVDSPVRTLTVDNPGAGSPHGLAVTANPVMLDPNGTSTSQIQATVVDVSGHRVYSDNGSQIHFSTTAGTLMQSTAGTVNGVATVTLRAPSVPTPNLTVSATFNGLQSSSIELSALGSLASELSRHQQYLTRLEGFGYSVGAARNWVQSHIAPGNPTAADADAFQHLLLTEKFMAHALVYCPNGSASCSYGDTDPAAVYGVNTAIMEASQNLMEFGASVAVTAATLSWSMRKGLHMVFGDLIPDAYNQYMVKDAVFDLLVHRTQSQIDDELEKGISDPATRNSWSNGILVALTTMSAKAQSYMGSGMEYDDIVEAVLTAGGDALLGPRLRRDWKSNTQPLLDEAVNHCSHPNQFPPLSETLNAYDTARGNVITATNMAHEYVDALDEDVASVAADCAREFASIPPGLSLLNFWHFVRTIGECTARLIGEVVGVNGIVRNIAVATFVADALDQGARDGYQYFLSHGVRTAQEAAAVLAAAPPTPAAPTHHYSRQALDENLATLDQVSAMLITALNELNTSLLLADSARSAAAITALREAAVGMETGCNISLAPCFGAFQAARQCVPAADSVLSQSLFAKDRLLTLLNTTLVQSNAYIAQPADSTVLSILDSINVCREVIPPLPTTIAQTAETFIGLPLTPVFLITAIVLPDTVEYDQPALVTVWVQNLGGASAGTDSMHLSADWEFSATPSVMCAIPALAAGDSVACSFEITLPASEADSMDYVPVNFRFTPQPQTGHGYAVVRSLWLRTGYSAPAIPQPPAGLCISYDGDWGLIWLYWKPVTRDLLNRPLAACVEYAIYRSDSVNFATGSQTYIGTTSDTLFIDLPDATDGAFYSVIAKAPGWQRGESHHGPQLSPFIPQRNDASRILNELRRAQRPGEHAR